MEQETKKIALFGGSFNPPHAGHLAIVRRLARRKGLDEVWILPVYRHRFRKRLFPFQDRMRLCRQVFLPLSPKVSVRPDERKVPESGKPGSGRTYFLIRYLKKRYPRHRFSLVLGRDAYQQRASWYRFDLIEKEVGLIIFPRGPGSFIPNVASRRVRRSGKIDPRLPEAVRRYLARRFKDQPN